MEPRRFHFPTEEEHYWAQKAFSGLDVSEHYVLQKYLDRKDGRILDAGCRGGRISFNLEKMGFSHIDACDTSDYMITTANENKKIADSNVVFFRQDMTDLHDFESGIYQYVIYLQQVLSFISPSLLEPALRESYRVLVTGGVAIFSFLNFEARWYNKALSFFLNVARHRRREHLPAQSLPWLRTGGRYNFRFFAKDQPTAYWFQKEEVLELLKRTGFSVIEVNTRGRILIDNQKKGALFVICQK